MSAPTCIQSPASILLLVLVVSLTWHLGGRIVSWIWPTTVTIARTTLNPEADDA